MNPSAIELMRQWLQQHGNPYIVGVSKELAAPFNAEFRRRCPKLYEVAKEHVRLCRRHTRRYGLGQPVYTYIDYQDINAYPLSAIDPYPKAPTAAVLLADTAMMLAARYPSLTDGSRLFSPAV